MALRNGRRRVVVIGGGNGSYINGVGFVNHDVDITLICPPADSGGSTGRLRGETGEVLPPGDARRALLALMRDPRHHQFFDSRFPVKGRDIDAHAIGNLIIDRAQEMFGVVGGLRYIQETFTAGGTVLPMTHEPTHLKVALGSSLTQKGEVLEAEHLLDQRDIKDDRRVEKVWLDPRTNILRDAAEAIRGAHFIILAFSDLYTSLLPNLLVRGAREAIVAAQKAGAKVVYELPLMSKKSETDGYNLGSFVQTISDYAHLPKLDAVVVHNGELPKHLIDLYWERERSHPIEIKWTQYQRSLFKAFVPADLLSSEGVREKLVRHDSVKLANTILGLGVQGGSLERRLTHFPTRTPAA